jgi:hypothetical protein
MKKLTLLTTFIVSVLTLLTTFIVTADGANQYGTYTCIVHEVHGNDYFAEEWLGARLIFDADKGVLDAIKDPVLPYTRMFSRLKVVSGPWFQNHLHAVQYDPVGFGGDDGNITPVVAWLMIKVLDDPEFPEFTFFSTGIRSIATGSCSHN